MTQYPHLHWTSPHMKGEAVKKLQRAIGATVDGEYGDQTASLVRKTKFLLGFPDKALDTGATSFFQQILYGDRHASQEYVKRAAAHKKAAAANKTDAEKACAFLMERVGRTEIAPGHGFGINREPDWLDKWQIDNGHGRYGSNAEGGWPWCGVAIWAAFHYGAGRTLDGRLRSVEFIYYASKAGTNNLYRVNLADVRMGDLLVCYSPNTHVAMARGPYKAGKVPTVEGNTSFGPGGDQANGGALAARDREKGIIVAAARVRRAA